MDVIIRVVFELLVCGLARLIARFGQAVARAVVPALARGYVAVEESPGTRPILFRRWHGIHRATDGSLVMGGGLASIVGLMLTAAIILVGILVAARLFGP